MGRLIAKREFRAFNFCYRTLNSTMISVWTVLLFNSLCCKSWMYYSFIYKSEKDPNCQRILQLSNTQARIKDKRSDMKISTLKQQLSEYTGFDPELIKLSFVNDQQKCAFWLHTMRERSTQTINECRIWRDSPCELPSDSSLRDQQISDYANILIDVPKFSPIQDKSPNSPAMDPMFSFSKEQEDINQWNQQLFHQSTLSKPVEEIIHDALCMFIEFEYKWETKSESGTDSETYYSLRSSYIGPGPNRDILKLRFKVPLEYTIGQVKAEVSERVKFLKEKDQRVIWNPLHQFVKFPGQSIPCNDDSKKLRDLRYELGRKLKDASKHLVGHKWSGFQVPDVWKVPILTIEYMPEITPTPTENRERIKQIRASRAEEPHVETDSPNTPRRRSKRSKNRRASGLAEQNEETVGINNAEATKLTILGSLILILITFLIMWVFFENRGHQILYFSELHENHNSNSNSFV